LTFAKFIRSVLIFEAIVLNIGTGLLCILAPNFFVAQFTAQSIPSVALEFLRWYGVVLWVLAYVVLRILPMNDQRMLFPAVESLLMGDVVHLIAVFWFFQVMPVWSFAFIVMLIAASTLAVLRSIWLYRYHTHRLEGTP